MLIFPSKLFITCITKERWSPPFSAFEYLLAGKCLLKSSLSKPGKKEGPLVLGISVCGP